MKIAMLCSSHQVNDARVAHKQAHSLARMGHEVVVFGREPKKTEQIPLVSLCPLAPVGGGMLRRLSMIFKLYRVAKLWGPDIVVCHEPESMLAGLFLKYRCKIKVIFDAHECFQETLSQRMPKLLIRPIVRASTIALLKILVRYSDWVTVVSPPNQKFLLAMRHDERVDVIHNSPIMELFPPCNQNTDGLVTVIHDGFFYRERGLVQILEAIAIARRSRNIQFIVLGYVKPQDQDLFDRKLTELQLNDVVKVSGWIPWPEIGKIESQAQIGLICLQNTPNNFMSLSNKLYSYMCCGLAIIAPEGSATADIVCKYNCGLCVDTSKPEDIAEAISNLYDNVELRKQMGYNGRKAIEEHLGWHKMEELLEQIYKQLGS